MRLLSNQQTTGKHHSSVKIRAQEKATDVPIHHYHGIPSYLSVILSPVSILPASDGRGESSPTFLSPSAPVRFRSSITPKVCQNKALLYLPNLSSFNDEIIIGAVLLPMVIHK
jgi:hypothetical protein